MKDFDTRASLPEKGEAWSPLRERLVSLGADPETGPVGEHTEPVTEANARLYQEQTTVALREHRLLHRYFPVLMANYPESKNAEWEAALGAEELEDYAFTSKVSMNLITRWRIPGFWMAIGVGLALLWVHQRWAANRS